MFLLVSEGGARSVDPERWAPGSFELSRGILRSKQASGRPPPPSRSPGQLPLVITIMNINRDNDDNYN